MTQNKAQEPCVYKAVIEHAVKAGLKDYAENLASAAKNKWSEKSAEIDAWLEGPKADPTQSAQAA